MIQIKLRGGKIAYMGTKEEKEKFQELMEMEEAMRQHRMERVVLIKEEKFEDKYNDYK